MSILSTKLISYGFWVSVCTDHLSEWVWLSCPFWTIKGGCRTLLKLDFCSELALNYIKFCFSTDHAEYGVRLLNLPLLTLNNFWYKMIFLLFDSDNFWFTTQLLSRLIQNLEAIFQTFMIVKDSESSLLLVSPVTYFGIKSLNSDCLNNFLTCYFIRDLLVTLNSILCN